jgi:hypothetical protein
MGALNISNGGQLEFRPTVSSAGMSIGGDQFLGGGIGTVTLSGGSSIVRSGPFSGIGINIGWTGTGTVLMTGGSYIDVGTGNLSVAGSPPVGFNSGNGNLTFNSGSKLLAGTVNIGGSGDTSSGGLGSVTLSGADSELRAMASNGFLGVGRGGGTGTLSALSGAKISTISASIGRSGGIGTLVVNNATYEATGQQTVTGGLGANLSIGLGGANGPGIGVASFVGSTISIVNDSALNADGGVATAALNLGGRKDLSGGSGTLLLSNSQLNISAPNGLADINIGHSGTGTATLNASAVNAAGGNIYVAREVGSVGTLTMVNGSTIDAGFVGIGVSAKYDGVAQANGGTGTLVLNNSTIRTAGFELGAGSVLTGDGGTIEIIPSSGDVVIGGTIAPGNSPGRLRIRCNVIMLPGSKVILEVSGNGNSLDEYGIDELIIDGNATFNLASAQIEFSFLADTNPNNFAAIGGMNLDNFFRTETGNTTAGLSTKFAAGQSWSTTVDTSSITARSESAAYSNIQINYAGNGNVNVVAVPEPSTWGMLFAGLCAVGAVARRRRVQAAQA